MGGPENRMGGRGVCSALFFAGLLINSQAALALDYQRFGSVSIQLVSEPEPIKDTLSNWGDKFDRGERQWAVGRIEAGVRYNSGLELSLFSRILADLRLNEDAVRFYGQISRKEPLEAGKTVPVTVRANGLVGHGLRLGYTQNQDTWSLGAGVSLFSASRLMAGGLNGEFSALSDTDYNFNADVDYVYNRDVIFKRPDVEPADGIGWSMDVSGKWSSSEAFQLSGSVEDVFARVRWKDAPFTRAKANTDQKDFDEDGFAVFRPLISGTTGYLDTFNQRLSPRYKAEALWAGDHATLLVRAQHQFGYTLLGFGLGRMVTAQTQWRAIYWPDTESIGLELTRGLWSVGLAADRLRWAETRAFGLSVSYGFGRTPF